MGNVFTRANTTIAAFISRHCKVDTRWGSWYHDHHGASCVSIRLWRTRSKIRMNHWPGESLDHEEPCSVFTPSPDCVQSSLLTSHGCPALNASKNTEMAERKEKNWAWFNLVLTSSMEALWHQINDWHEWDQEFSMGLFISREVVIDCYSW